LSQPPACASCCCNLQLALAVAPFCQTGGEPPTRIGCSTLRLHRFRFTQLAPNVSTSGWAFDAPLTSTEPCIAGKAADEYSLSAGSRTLRICQLNYFRLASALVSSGAASDPSRAFAPGFTLWLGRRRFSDSHRLFVPPTVPATNSRCPTGSSVVPTLRPANLWMQVQNAESFVDFTKVGAKLRVLEVRRGIWRFAKAQAGLKNQSSCTRLGAVSGRKVTHSGIVEVLRRCQPRRWSWPRCDGRPSRRSQAVSTYKQARVERMPRETQRNCG
jgi:hypothetical protein